MQRVFSVLPGVYFPFCAAVLRTLYFPFCSTYIFGFVQCQAVCSVYFLVCAAFCAAEIHYTNDFEGQHHFLPIVKRYFDLFDGH